VGGRRRNAQHHQQGSQKSTDEKARFVQLLMSAKVFCPHHQTQNGVHTYMRPLVEKREIVERCFGNGHQANHPYHQDETGGEGIGHNDVSAIIRFLQSCWFHISNVFLANEWLIMSSVMCEIVALCVEKPLNRIAKM